MAHRPPSAVAALAGQRYVSLATFKRDGSAVQTPLWLVGVDAKLYAFTDGTSAKVKRLRRNSRVQIAACDAFGKLLGDWIHGQAHIIDDASRCEQVFAALREKYGWQLRLLDCISWLGGRISRRAIIEIAAPRD